MCSQPGSPSEKPFLTRKKEMQNVDCRNAILKNREKKYKMKVKTKKASILKGWSLAQHNQNLLRRKKLA